MSPVAARVLGADRGGAGRGGALGGGAGRIGTGQGRSPQIGGGGGAGGGGSDAEIFIQPSTELNAVIVRGAPAAIAEIGGLIAQLDQRRQQVLIEAAIVEISGNAAEQLGVQFGRGDAALDGSFGATSFPTPGPSVANVLSILGVPASVVIGGEGLSAGSSPTTGSRARARCRCSATCRSSGGSFAPTAYRATSARSSSSCAR